MAVASEAEATTLVTNMKEGVLHQTALKEMGWPQPPSHITVNNSTTAGLAQDTIKDNKSCAMGMQLHWIQDCAQQQQFNVVWALGAINKADYFTKLHAPIIHHHMRPVYLHITPLTTPALLPLDNLSCWGVLNHGFQS